MSFKVSPLGIKGFSVALAMLTGAITMGASLLTLAGYAKDIEQPSVQTLKRASAPIKIEATTPVAEDAPEGSAFEGVLRHSLVDSKNPNRQIPQGTLLRGHVKANRESRRFARGGYFDIQLDEAVFPGGASYRFDSQKLSEKMQDSRYHHRETITVQHLLKSSIPYALVTGGTTIPLSLATNLGRLAIYGVTVGTRSTAAGIDQIRYRDEYPDAAHYLGTAVARGTGLKAAYSTAIISKHPSIEPGQTVRLRLPESWMNGLLDAGESMEALSSQEVLQ
ncbi:MAG: hypothetical protein VKJ04_09100 [Vampirovibrionales bacterium]|nr:hypothetical protein [Vampirovibrionales bacterium]